MPEACDHAAIEPSRRVRTGFEETYTLATLRDLLPPKLIPASCGRETRWRFWPGRVAVPRSALSGRRSIRLKGYDYAQAGAYFVTLCTQGRSFLFGEIADNEMQANEAGAMVIEEWHALPTRYPGVHLDALVLMPNHLHAILFLAPEEAAGAGLVPAPGSVTPEVGATTRVAPTLGDVVGAFKSITTVQYARGVDTRGWPAFSKRLWQRNYL